MMNIDKKFRELLEEYDLHEDGEMIEFANEMFELGCEYAEEKKREGYGNREDDEEYFRQSWADGGYGMRSGGSGGSSSGGRGGNSGGGYGQRRGVKNTGPYGGEYLRRRRR